MSKIGAGTRYGPGTGKLGSDSRTWLSAVLDYQDTCLEGFDGSKDGAKSLVEPTLNEITSSVNNILSMVRHQTPYSNPKGGRARRIIREEFPSWIKYKDKRKLIQAMKRDSADVVVAVDGTGNFTSINDAIDFAPKRSSEWFVIYIKRGVYKEYVEIGRSKWNIVLMGDGMDATVITGNRNYFDGWRTFMCATFRVKGPRFIARDITFENTAGPHKYQAVAFLSNSDLSALYRCAFRGYQDTLYAHTMRQFYKDCTITGTVDFIFGRSSAVFQNCQILARKGLPKQKNTITANGRRNPYDKTGFSIQFSNISVEAELLASRENIQTYLGRPWKLYSTTVIMQSYISSAIHPKGWLEWKGNYALDTLYYGEYMNFGPGACLDNRVNWPGFHEIKDSAVANNFTVAQLILGNSWLPSTGIKYIDGLHE
ncbi:hypothetical protein ACH5RR_003926 [Cinchona calisaya]|uniref:Pectinesterase n=1 Tax=Cinchona calisaya TaxID=153742 RepID=A0ABD3AW39_9GENT